MNLTTNSGAARHVLGGHAPQVAVVGGGIAGAVCSSVLATRGADVTVFDMGRTAPGGRLTSRITPDGHQFDAGGQFFQARSPAMRARVREWMQAGVVAEWRPVLGVYDAASGTLRRREALSSEERRALSDSFFGALLAEADSNPMYVGVPSMGALVGHLLTPRARREPGEAGEASAAGSLQLRLNTKVQAARFADGSWWLGGAASQQPDGGSRGAGAERDSLGCFDALVLADCQVAREGSPGHVAFQGGPAGPPPGALAQLLRRLGELPRTPLLTLMLVWDTATHGSLLPGGAEAAIVAGGAGTAFQWVAADSSKPGRSLDAGLTRWVAVTRPDFAAELIQRMGSGSVAAAAAAAAKTGGLPPQDAAYRGSLAEQMWAALQRDLTGGRPGPLHAGARPLAAPLHLSAQRWGGGLPAADLGQSALWHDAERWAVCGDFCGGGGGGGGAGIEAAANSGADAAEAVAAMLGLP